MTLGCWLLALASCANSSDLDDSGGTQPGTGGSGATGGSDAAASGGDASSNGGSSASGGLGGNQGGQSGSGTGGVSGASGASGASGGTGAVGGAGGVGGASGGAGGTGGAVGVDDPNPNTRCSGNQVITPIVFPAGTKWATSVLSMSSEYTSASWSAVQALGVPDTYPNHGDITTAWATLSADAAGEFISVGFSPSASGSMIYIVETYHPDAVSTVTITLEGGATSQVYTKPPASVGDCAYVLGVPTGTTQAITAVRIDLGSELVPGWNEIDAIGIVP